MKKIILLLFMVFLFTGCYNINNLSIDEIIDINIKETNKPNTYLKGYKLYTPVDMTLINDTNSNNILYSDGDKYYLYVDIVSFYNKVNNTYNNENSTYYFKSLNYNGITGYVQIFELNDKYLLEIMYNYAKIEVVTNNINEALSKSIIILNSINYNEKVVETLILNDGPLYDEESFKLLGPTVYTDNFIQYIEDYGTYEEDAKDEDILDLITD